MRLLFDQMLSYKLPRLLEDVYPHSTHVGPIGLAEDPDHVVWEHAREYDFIVTSEDTDFVEISRRLGFPPKLVLIKIGNAPTRVIAHALRRDYQAISAFSEDEDQGIYELET